MTGAQPPAVIRLLDAGAPTIPFMWRTLVEAYAARTLLRRNGVAHSFEDIDRRSAAMARGLLAEGVGKGSKVGVLAPNGSEWVVAWLAASRIGATAVCLSTLASADELAYAIAHSDLAVLLCADRYLRHDYVGRLERSFPGLEGAAASAGLRLTQAPFLRRVWFTGETDRAWASGSFAQLEAQGQTSALFGADLLAAAERSVTPADPAIMMYTSGSTAHPKGVVHTHGTVARKLVDLSRDRGIIPFDVREDDRLIIPSPFFWVGGFLSLGGAMLHGAEVICVDEHSPAALLERVREDHATHLGVAEAKLIELQGSAAYRPGDFDRLRPENAFQFAFFQGTRELRARIPNSLGMTETMGPHSGDLLGRMLPPHAAGSVCKVLPGMEYKIIDPQTGGRLPNGEAGELCVRGVYLMDGMYKRERCEVFDADGFYHTGDQCYLRDDGYLFFLNRISGMIKTNGANVSPEEVEVAIMGGGDVAEAAVMGIPDAKAGQIVVAAIVLRGGANVTEGDIRARLVDRLSSFKIPKRMFFFNYDELPRTPSNKIRKPPLALVLAERLADERG